MKLDAQSVIQFWNESLDVRTFASVRHPHIYEMMRKVALRFLLGVHVLRHVDSFHSFHACIFISSWLQSLFLELEGSWFRALSTSFKTDENDCM